jgi:hypothetical protein
VNRLKGDLSNATTFNPPLFSLVFKCKQTDCFVYSELELLHRCLDPFVDRRPTPTDLLHSELLTDLGPHHGPPLYRFKPPAFPSLDLRCRDLALPVSCAQKRALDFLSVREIYYLWQLAGGDVFAELRKHGLMITTPPVVSIPSLLVGEGQVREFLHL